ncbi:MAG: exodeoxyribonuclease III [Lautropia sp.]|nr:exodeoxyribonuclease III [Lautropia sp.]
MLRVVSQNLNGIRSAARKGWFEWAAGIGADAICVQEVRAQLADLSEPMRAIGPAVGHFHLAERKGYSGVGIYTAQQPQSVREGFGQAAFDAEGRYIEMDFGTHTIISVYVPSGSSSEERLQQKFIFMDAFAAHMQALKDSGREIILCGDWNVAHKEIDLKNWRSNQKNSGFLPEERAWMTRLFDEIGFVDVFRTLDERPEQYTWWSNRGQAWAKNVGWRLDYQIATPGIAATAKRVEIYKDERFSDHAPLIIDYEWPAG